MLQHATFRIKHPSDVFFTSTFLPSGHLCRELLTLQPNLLRPGLTSVATSTQNRRKTSAVTLPTWDAMHVLFSRAQNPCLPSADQSHAAGEGLRAESEAKVPGAPKSNLVIAFLRWPTPTSSKKRLMANLHCAKLYPSSVSVC